MIPKNTNNLLNNRRLKFALGEVEKASPEKLSEVTGAWCNQFLALAFNIFLIESKQAKHLPKLAMKTHNSKRGSKKYLTEMYKVLSQVNGIKWIKEI